MHAGLGQGQFALGTAQEIVGVLGRGGQQQGQGIGLADVLHRHAHQPPGDEQWVLPAVEHAGQPVEGGVRIGAAHRLMQGGDQVVVLLAVLVVGGAALLQHLAQLGRRERLGDPNVEQGLGQGQQVAAVAVGHGDHRLARGVVERQGSALMRLGLVQQGLQRRFVQTAQDIDLTTRQQGPVQFKRRIFGGGPHQGDDPLLDEGQEAVLLGAVEAVDFVDEQQGRLAGGAAHAGGLEGLLQVGDA